MKGTILEKIINAKRERVEIDKRDRGEELNELAATRASGRKNRFSDSIRSLSKINVIAEFKRASPSKGVLNTTADPAETARMYERSGAAAISVLTEEDHFLGSLDDLETVRASVNIPILRKDFIIDEFQIIESAAAGADAILLIAAVLPSDQLSAFLQCADSFKLDTIVEVHNDREFEVAVSVGAAVIGVNNRDLRTFDVNLDVSRDLIARKPPGSIMISESGISSREEIIELHELGYSAFLIGEALMRSGDLARCLGELSGRGRQQADPLED